MGESTVIRNYACSRVVGLRLLALVLAAVASPATGQICTVPGAYVTIQAAADDPACAEIRLTLASYRESVGIVRSLTLKGMTGQPVVIEGRVQVKGVRALVDLENLAIQSGCPDRTLLATGGATVHGVELSALRSAALPCPPLAPLLIFADDFESGDTSVWSSTVP